MKLRDHYLRIASDSHGRDCNHQRSVADTSLPYHLNVAIGMSSCNIPSSRIADGM